MPKLKNPPQGGEKYLCLTLFCTMFLAVVSAVGIIYSIVIVYVPAKKVLESNLDGPKMCTTLSLQKDLDSVELCEDWTSCHEWCLSKSNKECSHVWAKTRHPGTEIYWEGCDFTEDNFVNLTCTLLEDLELLNCKLFSTEKDVDGNVGDGDAETCVNFTDLIISCESGICRNVSDVYRCDFQNRLTDIENAWENGYCHCNHCNDSSVAYPGECPRDTTSYCNRERPSGFNGNETIMDMCSKYPCATCKAVCEQRGECFDMKSRKDPTIIGTDEFGNSVLGYFTCTDGYCIEIYNLTCERRCNSKTFHLEDKNSVIFNGETIIVGKCSARSTASVSRLKSKVANHDILFVACSNVTFDAEARSMISRDCVNGTWFPENFNNGKTNYSLMQNKYHDLRDNPRFIAEEIAYEHDITIFNRTKLKINIEGCVNTLSEECKAFYKDFGRDGRNYTARAIYPCYYDEENDDFVVINFNPDKTLMLLIFFAAIPGGIMAFSCTYMCGCSRFIHTAEDGHMRLRCCGKYVTGIGNVPVWDPPKRKQYFAKQGS